MNTFTLNGTTITAAKFNFNTVCEFDEMGVSIDTLAKKPLSTIRAYVAISAGISLEQAGSLVEEHVVNGGDIAPILDAMNAELSESDFFQSLQKNAEAKATKTPGATKKA